MTEEEARDRVETIGGPEALGRLDRFVAMVVAENARQNLIAHSTVATIWTRHVLDSVQLIPLANHDGHWIDIGTGGGFPGLAVAATVQRPMTLVEPRRRRAEFLAEAARELRLDHVEVVTGKIENASPRKAMVISARAVASTSRLFDLASHCASKATTWILPRGGGWSQERYEVERHWHAVFHVEQSLTDPAASIVIATDVRAA